MKLALAVVVIAVVVPTAASGGGDSSAAGPLVRTAVPPRDEPHPPDGTFPPAQESGRSVWDGVYTGEQAARGQQAYEQHCAQCHVNDLLGSGMAPALAGSMFASRWQGLTVGNLFAAIRTTMPLGAPGSLSAQAYTEIVSYLLEVNQYPPGDQELPSDMEALEQIIIEEGKPAQ